ncbi:MAG: hypothetical protein H0V54_08970 [Chthoniobacterales bacterium]|nr:hypothetical protein [Chthoniobacterales bacterium]
MKHKPDACTARWLARYDRPPRGHISFWRIDCAFQPRRLGDSFGDSDLPRRRQGFSRLAREVLHNDASRRFRLETAVLGLVALVSAWPIVVMIHEVYRLLK